MSKPPLYVKVWLWLLVRARYSTANGLRRGQVRTSLPEIQDAMTHKVGYRKVRPSKKEIWGILEWLRNPDQCRESLRNHDQSLAESESARNPHEGTTKVTMIVTTKVTHGIVITICNYEYYQDWKNYEGNDEGNDEGTAKVTTGEQYNRNASSKGRKRKQTPRSKNSNGGSRRSVTPDPTFEELLSRYSEPEQASIRECFKALAITRKSGKISDSVLLAQLKYWSAFEQWKVIGGIEVYLQKETHLTGRGEDYLRGIIRKFIPGELKRHSRPADPPVITTEEMYSRLKVL